MCESQGGNPIGKVLVIIIIIKVKTPIPKIKGVGQTVQPVDKKSNINFRYNDISSIIYSNHEL